MKFLSNMRNAGKSNLRSAVLALCVAALLAAVPASGSDTQLLESGTLNRINSILPKHRVVITGGYAPGGAGGFEPSLFSFTGQGADVESRLDAYFKDDDTNMSEAVSQPYGAAHAAAGGYVNDVVQYGSSFMGLTEGSGRVGIVCRAYVNSATSDQNIYLHPLRKGQALRPVTVSLPISVNIWKNKILLHAEDWNADGYSDYIVTVAVDEARSSWSLICAYVDGKELWEAATDETMPAQVTPKTMCGELGLTVQHWAEGSAKLDFDAETGDLDGDGINDFMFWYLQPHVTADLPLPKTQLHAFRVIAGDGFARFEEFPQSGLGGAGVPTERIDTHPRFGIQNTTYGGKAVILHGIADGKLFWNEAYFIDGVLQIDGAGPDAAIPEAADMDEVYDVVVTDLDGKGSEAMGQKIIAGKVVTSGGKERPILVVEDMNTNPSWNRRYDLSVDGQGDFEPAFGISLALGHFVPLDINRTYEGVLPQQLAAVYATKNGVYIWVIFSYSHDEGLAFLGYGAGGGEGKGILAPALAAADLDNESLVLGDPLPIKVAGGVIPTLTLQGPPRHWDVISADAAYSGLTADAGGNVETEAFGRLAGYQTEYSAQATGKKITSNTKNTQWGWGISTTQDISLGQPESAFASLQVTESYAKDYTDTHVDSSSYQTTTTLSAKVAYDDALYYNAVDYTIWRYPILFPASLNTVQSGDQTVPGINFLQFVTAESATVNLLPAAGRSVSWYEPEHDNFNLFTYPRDATKTKEYQTWYEMNSSQLARASRTPIGGANAASATVEVTDTTAQSDLSDVKSKLSTSATATVGGTIKSLLGLKVSVTGNYDRLWQTTSLTQTDASQMSGITVNWPATEDFSKVSKYPLEEQWFLADILMYLSPTGVVNAAYSVSGLKRTGDFTSSSRLWGSGSPYATYPDPGLFLPFRFNTDTTRNVTPFAYKMRGTTFNPALAHGIVPVGLENAVQFRVYNYSFVETAQIAYDVLFQPAGIDSAGMTEGPDVTKATITVYSGTTGSIPGRDSGSGPAGAAGDNWRDVAFPWTPPAEDGSGYLHFILRVDGKELSTDNNYGFVPVGFFNPTSIPLQNAASILQNAGSVGRSGGKVLAVSETHDLRIHDVVVRDMNGATLDKNALPDDEPMEIECVVALDAQDTAEIGGTPMMYVNLLVNGDALVASEHAPYMKNDTKHRFTIKYDPAPHSDLVKLETLVLSTTSHYVPGGDDLDPTNHEVTMRFADGGDGKPGSGGGGCDAGFGAMAVMLLAALGAGMRGRKAKWVNSRR